MVNGGNLLSGWRTPFVVLVAGCLISAVGFGARSGFGVFLEPMTLARGWDRETFALAMAIQNLLWGLGMPVAGALADKYGAPRVIAGGAVAYMLGILGMVEAQSGIALYLTGGVLAGVGVAFTAFALAMAAMVRVVGPERRSLALGLGTAAGSAGQVIFSPLGHMFIAAFGWPVALLLFGLMTLLIIPLAFLLPGDPTVAGESEKLTLRAALGEAFGHRGYLLLTAGFFVCGFQVAFITVHLPAYVGDLGLDPVVGAYAIALVGLFNIAGSLLSGAYGQRHSMRIGLAWIYFLRSVVIAGLLMAPKTALTIYIFAATIGILWLSTVPLTTGLVARIFGVRYMATLFGVVFLSHQLGSFSGIWLGGYLHDRTGSYDVVWYTAIALGIAAALIHLPIDERPLARVARTG